MCKFGKPNKLLAFIMAVVFAMGLFPYSVMASESIIANDAQETETVVQNGNTGDSIQKSVFPLEQRKNPVACGQNHTIVVAEDGTVWAWGNNQYHQAGGSGNGSSIPKKISDLQNIVSVEAGAWSSYALKSDGTVWAWGYNSSGQMGQTQGGGSTPKQVPNISNIVDISAGANGCIALKSDGTLWAWGTNNGGSLGLSETIDLNIKYLPQKINGIENVTAISISTQHTLALCSDGSVWSWGANGNGQLGFDKNQSIYYKPTQIKGLSNIISVFAGIFTSYVIDRDGILWAFGSEHNISGISPHIPKKVAGLDGVQKLSSSQSVRLALMPDKKVYTFSWPDYTPQQVPNLENIIDIARGSSFGIALKEDGTLWSWGNNYYSQLGRDSVPPNPSTQHPLGQVNLGFKVMMPGRVPSNSNNTEDNLDTNALITLPLPHSRSVKVTWNDEMFAKSAYEYNHDLATVCVALSTTAYGDDSDTSGNKVSEALTVLGFTDIEQYKYDGTHSVSGGHTVAYSFAHKEITIAGEKSIIIATIIRGTKGSVEWGSNLTIGTSQDHEGFSMATAGVFSNLKQYIDSHSFSGNLKFLVTGHSRGAAVANLLASRINKEKSPMGVPKAVYAYTFATPNTTRSADVSSSTHKNIFNIVNAPDIVPYVPMSGEQWRYWKYGITMAFPSKGLTVEFQSKHKAKVENEYKAIMGQSEKYTSVQFGITQVVVDNLYELAPTTNIFAFLVQTALEKGENLKDALIDVMGYVIIANLFGVDDFSSLGFLNEHQPWVYLSWMKATDKSIQQNTGLNGRYARIACPVDIDVYDSKGKLRAKVVNNAVVNVDTDSEVYIYIDGDVKHVYVPSYDTYSIKMTGTDTGMMECTFETVDITTASTTEQKIFKNISLHAGKEIVSEIADENIGNIQLIVTESGQVVSEIAQDGTEIPIFNDWKKENGQWYYYSNGTKQTGWLKDGDKWYYLGKDGAMQMGWLSQGGWYYLKGNGAMATGWQKIGNIWYYFRSSGKMATGWSQQGNTWYYLKSNGAMATGWQKIGNSWYYLKSSGAMSTGWLKVGSSWYYLKSNGAMQTGWLKLGNTWYWFNANGAMATGTQTINGKIYKFNANGAWIS